jgi:VWFA-related protein
VSWWLLSLLTPSSAQQRTKQAAQAKPDETRIRVSTNLVLVSAVVTGKKDRPVTTLKPEDFSITEDNVPQIIEFFQVDRIREHHPSQVSLIDGKPTAVLELPPVVAANPDNMSITALLLDYSTTTLANQKLVREGGRKFIEKIADGHDLIAVFAFDSGLRTLQNLTRDKHLLLEALKLSGSRGDSVAAERLGLAQGASDMVAREEALSQQIGDLLSARQAGLPVAPIKLAMSQAWFELARYAELQYYSLRSAMEDEVSRSVLLAIQAVADGLRPFPGRKSLILLSQGFAVPPTVRKVMDSALAAAIRSNTAIYCIDARGLVNDRAAVSGTELDTISASQRGDRTRVVNGESEFDRAALVGSDQEESLLRYLSLSTGGLYLHNTNDLFRSFRRIDEDVHSHYLLAYTSTNRSMDGSFRTIRVEVRPKGLKVRARKGYYATP